MNCFFGKYICLGCEQMVNMQEFGLTFVDPPPKQNRLLSTTNWVSESNPQKLAR